MMQRARLDHGVRVCVPCTGRAPLPLDETPLDPASCEASPWAPEMLHQPRRRYQQDYSEDDEEPARDGVNNAKSPNERDER